MILIIIVLFIALLWALREIFVGFWVWKTRRSYIPKRLGKNQ